MVVPDPSLTKFGLYPARFPAYLTSTFTHILVAEILSSFRSPRYVYEFFLDQMQDETDAFLILQYNWDVKI